MSTHQSLSTLATNASSANRPFLPRRWLREPLLHFLILGGLLFAIDRYLVDHGDDPNTIVITEEVDDEGEEVFQEARGRAPTRDELKAMQRIWLDNEVLYREGLAMQLDKGDKTIRDRVIFKALSIIDSGLKLPTYDDKTLRDWFEGHRAKYDEPKRFDFQEAVLPGDHSEAAVRAFVKELNTGTPGDAKAGLRVFTGRPEANLLQSYGEAFTRSLQESPPGEWRALLTREGWRAFRLDAVSAPRPAAFEDLRGVVLQDWTDATMAELRTAAVRELAKKYKIRIEVVGG